MKMDGVLKTMRLSNRMMIFIMILGILLLLSSTFVKSSPYTGKKYDIVIYGGGPQAVAAALKASETSHDHAKILMIVPESKLGSILTAGDQNIFDQVTYHSSKLPVGLPADYSYPQGGTNFVLQKEFPRSFPPDALADYMTKLIQQHRNITVQMSADITEVSTLDSVVQYVVSQPLVKGEKNRLVYGSGPKDRLYAPIFIDASETGRFIRLAGFHGTVGREDQDGDQTQMNATLMFKVKNINKETIRVAHPYVNSKGLLQVWGGHDEGNQDPIASFNQTSTQFYIKPYNGASDSKQNNELWMNLLLIYNVDARKAWRDQVADNGFYPKSNGLDPEEAREICRKEIGSPEFLQNLRSIKGFERAELVTENGQPVVGEIMYLRESLHAYHQGNQFGLNKQSVFDDQVNYAHRIGLGFYHFDTNGYKTVKKLANPIRKEPWYVPYEVLTTDSIKNVLLPGYAASIDSFSWSAMRVYPNLMVLGDAAGTAAGLALQGQFHLQAPSNQEIEKLQHTLKSLQVIIDK
ncbi:MAG TPA: FAD-dependent oxidoreductase [Bacillota bacterium]|nr:FAD-dependent oxidoreductase [Bacillota bacterium]